MLVVGRFPKGVEGVVSVEVAQPDHESGREGAGGFGLMVRKWKSVVRELLWVQSL